MAHKDPLIGHKLGDYTVVDVLGHGGMAKVYRGYDDKLERYAAVKVINARQAKGGENPAEYRERFQREARAIARLRHPNIVDIYQFGEDGELYYMAMGFVDGRDLRQLLREYGKKDKPMPYGEALRIIHDVAYALDHAHRGGVIHRDIKPSNIMVTGDGQAILTDFGLALSVPEGTMGGTFGSVYYIAPEQAMSSANAVPQSDIYSLGVVLYEMMTGHVPFEDDSAMSVALKHLHDTPPAPRTFNPDLPAEVEAVILKAMEKQPENRFRSGAALAQALETALAHTDLESTNPLPLAALDSRPRAPLPPLPAAVPGVVSPGDADALRARRTARRRRRLRRLAIMYLILLMVVVLVRFYPGGLERVRGAFFAPSTPTVAPVVSQHQDAQDDQVMLIYDGASFVLFNRSDEPADVSSLLFVQVQSSGLQLAFDSNEWAGDGVPLNALPPEGCFHLWTNRIESMPKPDYCAARYAWRQASSPHWFWVSDEPEASFEVRRRGQVLATCPIAEDADCSVDVRGTRS